MTRLHYYVSERPKAPDHGQALPGLPVLLRGCRTWSQREYFFGVRGHLLA
jgi:hypothetical protein